MNISVLGCGRWGAFLAWYLGRMEQHNVLLYGRERSWRMAQLRETRKNDLLDLPARVTLTSDIHKAVDNSEILLISIGVQSFRGFLRELSCCNLSGKKLVLCMKGLEAETGLRLPLRYNYDKPENPRISRVFSYLTRFFILFQTEKSSREVVIS